ncbi:hypothetical protein [Crocosphaera sp. XPORK-15E]|uniref:hypothetical protein n=1 Tax=Crocosphaera sp. XPORK-15E TaxID=3110247 RepID=UPI002B1FE594|nr:hypothetical protein [Crocosphaera sp. XPORK-15E]MEA5536596.1 hypothetical protein [Crocosphaera sp. XPORK-15E]
MKKLGIGQILYFIWLTLGISLSIVLAGFSAENITRLLVIGFILLQIALRSILVKAFPQLPHKTRFIVLATFLAAVVEGFHMISMPVFLSLRIGRDTSIMGGLIQYGIDLAFTLPAYLIIFSVIWYFINRFYFRFWPYVFVMGLAQTLGDGGLFFFLNAPAMLFFLPYPMTNYHAINIIPFLAVREHLKQERSVSFLSYLAVPAVITTYLICGAIIKVLGRFLGLE